MQKLITIKTLNVQNVGHNLCSKGKRIALHTLINKNKKLNSQFKNVEYEGHSTLKQKINYKYKEQKSIENQEKYEKRITPRQVFF